MGIKKTDSAARPRTRGMLLAVALAAIVGAVSTVAPAGALAADETVTAATSPAAGRIGRKVVAPAILSPGDLAAYQRIFELQRQGQWSAADREIARLDDDVLKGHVLSQRYLHPAYTSKFAELQAWMAAHADHPDAHRIYRLAQRKGKGELKAPRHKEEDEVAVDRVGDRESGNWELPELDGSRAVRELKHKVRRLVFDDQFADAAKIIAGIGDPADHDQLATVMAIRQFSLGNDEEVLRWAVPAADRSGDRIPQAHWISGLALWRLDRPEEARRHFEAVANARGSTWMIAAGAFWAARANLVAQRPEVVNHWLEIAAGYPRSFYGLLARRALGLSITFGWEASPLTDVDADLLKRVPAARRALALLQLDRKDAAEQELRGLVDTATPVLARSLLALANDADLPDLLVRMGGIVARQDGRFHDSSAFPVPGWTPHNGWQVDRALVLAFARQESGFNPRATSPAGAKGLMQLMPGTARWVAGHAVPVAKLYEPEYNLSLGQTYLMQLLKTNVVEGNLFFLAAAYNSGPGNLQKWATSVKHHDDALMFIEAIPSRETRVFIEKVMTNLWVYRSRLSQPMASMDAVVAGDWPYYEGMEKRQKLARQ